MRGSTPKSGVEFRESMIARTRAFALRVFKLCSSLPHTPEAAHIRSQLFRCASSVAANYRAAHRAKSDKDYLNKLKICEEEADESYFWMDMLVACDLINQQKIESLMHEANELTAIISACCITKRRHIEDNRRTS